MDRLHCIDKFTQAVSGWYRNIPVLSDSPYTREIHSQNLNYFKQVTMTAGDVGEIMSYDLYLQRMIFETGTFTAFPDGTSFISFVKSGKLLGYEGNRFYSEELFAEHIGPHEYLHVAAWARFRIPAAIVIINPHEASGWYFGVAIPEPRSYLKAVGGSLRKYLMINSTMLLAPGLGGYPSTDSGEHAWGEALAIRLSTLPANIR